MKANRALLSTSRAVLLKYSNSSSEEDSRVRRLPLLFRFSFDRRIARERMEVLSRKGRISRKLVLDTLAKPCLSYRAWLEPSPASLACEQVWRL
jgi:hypothetical protein